MLLFDHGVDLGELDRRCEAAIELARAHAPRQQALVRRSTAARLASQGARESADRVLASLQARRHLPDVGWPVPVSAPDRWCELEGVVDRLARLVLHADALAERVRGDRLVTPDSVGRLRRLNAGASLGRRAIAAAIALS